MLIEAAGIALAIFGGRNDQIRDNRGHGRPKILKRFAGMVERLALAEVAASSNKMFWIGMTFIVTSRSTGGSTILLHALSHRGPKPFR